MGKEWFGLIGVVLGGFIAYIGALYRQKQEDKKERNRLLLDKYEDLHQTLSNIFETYNVVNMWAIHWLVHKRKKESFRDAYVEFRKVPIGKLRMLIDIYTPELNHSLVKFESFHKEFETNLKRTFHITDPEDKNVHKSLLKEKRDEIELICKELQEEVFKLSKSIIKSK